MSRIWTYLAIMSVGVFGVATVAEAQLPFQNIQAAPTVSPYLNLNANNGQGLPAYQTLVQPILQQQQDFNKQQNQIQNLQTQQRSLAAGGLTQPARGVSNAIRGTGHPSLFMTHGNYYPQAPFQTNDPIMRRLVTGDYNH